MRGIVAELLKPGKPVADIAGTPRLVAMRGIAPERLKLPDIQRVECIRCRVAMRGIAPERLKPCGMAGNARLPAPVFMWGISPQREKTPNAGWSKSNITPPLPMRAPPL